MSKINKPRNGDLSMILWGGVGRIKGLDSVPKERREKLEGGHFCCPYFLFWLIPPSELDPIAFYPLRYSTLPFTPFLLHSQLQPFIWILSYLTTHLILPSDTTLFLYSLPYCSASISFTLCKIRNYILFSAFGSCHRAPKPLIIS